MVLTAAPSASHPPPVRLSPWRDGALVGLVVAGAVLRCWALGVPRLSFDETFTATVARLPFGAMLTYLRRADAHPPLDYLVRAPLARAGVSEGWLRVPSVLESVAALGVAAWWWRPLGRVGLIATALVATSSYAIVYAHDARMYAGLALAGVVVAAAACRWLERPTVGSLCVVGVGVLVALLSQGGAVLILPGVLAVVGLRRDRAAWWWRLTVGGAGAIWAMFWGPAFIDQVGRTGSSWVPLTTPHSALTTVNELVDFTPVVAVLVVGLVAGGWLAMPPGPLRRVAGTLGGSVIATYLIVGVHSHVLLSRALAFAAWTPLLALAALCEYGLRRSQSIGAALVTLVAVLVGPSTITTLHPGQAPHAAAFDAVRHAARHGDEVVIAPSFLWTMPAWYFGARWDAHGSFVDRPDLQAQGTVIGGGRPDGRVWLVVSVAYRADTAGLRTCAPPQRLDQYVVYCLSDIDRAH